MLRKRKSGSDERFLFISETEKTMLKKDSYVMKTGDGVCLVMEELCMKAPGSPAPVPYYRLQPLKDPGIPSSQSSLASYPSSGSPPCSCAAVQE